MQDEIRKRRRVAAESLLALVAELGSVSAACRRLGLDRSAYYRIRKATRGAGGAAALPERPQAASPAIREAILRLCLENPEWGCDRLAHYLALTGSPVSSPTVQKILIRNGLGRRSQREAEAMRKSSGVNESEPGSEKGKA